MKYSLKLCLLLLLVLALGLSWPINKIGLNFTSASNYMQWRFIIGTASMFILALGRKTLKFPQIKDYPLILVIGIFQMASMMNLANYGLYFVDAGKATFLAFTVSVWIIPLSFYFNKKMPFLEICSLCIGLLGVFFLTDFSITYPFISKGEWLLILSANSWALGILAARHMHWHSKPFDLLPWQLLLATLITILIGIMQGSTLTFPSTHPVFITSLLYTGVISIGIGYWLLVTLSKQLSPVIISLGLLFVPILSLTLSAIFLHEPISHRIVLAAVLLTCANLIHIYKERIDAKK